MDLSHRLSTFRYMGGFRVRSRSFVAPMLVATMVAAAVAVATATASARVTHAAAASYHDGVFGPDSTRIWCDSTNTYTASRHIRTKIVRSTDGWSNTVQSRYRKF